MSSTKQRHPTQSARGWKELLPYANLGMTTAVALLGCGAVGWWVDQLLQSSPAGLLTGLCVGLAVALWEIWKVIRKLSRTEGPHL
ncbi:MAG: AtpZ/AtpI family protein [Candidatus Kapabacteria bacterium]|nr:AtpZ/AtpI family protein [Candidatus Kapabacteria bacterium]